MTHDPILTRSDDHLSLASIQPGSTVHASDGAEIGVVVAVNEDSLDVKRKGFLGGHVHIPRSIVAEVDGRHVELAVSAKDAHN